MPAANSATRPALENFDDQTQAWILQQVGDAPRWTDEYATHVARLFFPDEDFILVSDDEGES